MDLLSMILISLLGALMVPVSKFMASKTRIEWESNHWLEYSRFSLMAVFVVLVTCVSVYSIVNLWYSFFIGIGIGYFWKRSSLPFLGAALGSIFYFNSIFYLGFTLIILMVVTYGSKLKHVDFLLFLSMAVLFSYLNMYSIEITIFNLSATGGAIAGIMVSEVGLLWKKKEKKKKKQ